jgi:hypothetical protein
VKNPFCGEPQKMRVEAASRRFRAGPPMPTYANDSMSQLPSKSAVTLSFSHEDTKAGADRKYLVEAKSQVTHSDIIFTRGLKTFGTE